MNRRIIFVSLLILSPIVFFLVYSSQASRRAVITLNSEITFQTMMGWEAVAQAGQQDCPGFDQYGSELFKQAINDLGINRLRVEVRANGSTSLAFNISALDQKIEKIVLPMRELAQARNEKLFININFVGKSGFPEQPDMSVYAEQVLEVYRHLDSKYGFVPDAWEIALEPGLVSPGWGPAKLVDALARTDQILSSNGYPDPYLIAPSTPCGAELALTTINDMLRSNNNQPIAGLDEFAYHRYCQPNEQQLNAIRELGAEYGINTSMLEHGGANYLELHDDLKLANVSAWQQFALAYCTEDNGFQYYPIQGETFFLGVRTKYLRQYFKFVRFGAIRIEAAGDSSAFDPLAFINPDGTYVVIVKADIGGELEIRGLPEGDYGIKYTTDKEYDVDLPVVSIGTGQALETGIPEKGVITIYAQTSEHPNRFAMSTPVVDDLTLSGDKSCHISTIHLCRKK